MNHVYISNNSANNKSIDEIALSKEKGIEQLREKSVDDSGNTIFIIDVHCSFKKAEKLQQQGGVIIYRHLLKMFEGKQDKLKVVFYSPISKDDLVKLKPENYVLKLLPFIECIYEEGQFERDLSNEITKYEKEGWVQFNNASENLLSGWALTNKEKIEKGQYPEKINTNGKKILFIDDQQGEWKSVYSIIFENTTVLLIKNGKGKEIQSQVAYRQKLKSGWNYFVSLTKTAIKQSPDLILSDFYLEENHDVSKWKDISEIQKISGYKLFNEIRILAPSIPYVFHTSSNKASIYKFLDANGVDDWIVKDIRTESSKDEKQENFLEFKSCIEKFLCGYIFIQLNIIWKQIESVENNFGNLWWNNTNLANRKDTIFFILEESWFGLRRAAKKEALFEQAVYNSKISSDDSFTATAVINSMGKILELLKAAKKNGLAVIINSMRNIASHGRKDLNCFTIQDGILANHFLLELLEQKKASRTTIPRPNYKLYPPNSDESFKFALFWLYLQLYNSGYASSHLKVYKDIIEKRINEIFELAKNDTAFLNTLQTEFLIYKVIDANVQGRVLRKKANGNFEIAVKA